MQIYTAKLILYTIGIFTIAIIGALPPLFRKWSDKQLHLFIAFGAGVFLGSIFLHLLPEAMAEDSTNIASGMVLLGFLFILLVERTLLRTHNLHCDNACIHRHEMVGITAFIGLSVHSLTAGFALGVGMIDPELGMIIFIAIMAHKATAAFSLSTIFCLAGFSRKKILILILTFSLMTPIGAVISLPFIASLKDISLAIPTGLTAGTFLYVATLDLLPEAFHSDKERVSTFVWLILGVFVMLLIKLGGA